MFFVKNFTFFIILDEKNAFFDKKTQNLAARLNVFETFMEMLKFR